MNNVGIDLLYLMQSLSKVFNYNTPQQNIKDRRSRMILSKLNQLVEFNKEKWKKPPMRNPYLVTRPL
jgi:hypothetical protein